MEYKYIFLIIIVGLVLIGGIIYFGEKPTENVTENITPQNIHNNQTTTTKPQEMISAKEARDIAADYMAKNPIEFGNTTSGTPSLKNDVYYVPVIVTTNEGQHPPGTIVAYIRVDAKTGEVLGVEPIKMY